MNGIEGSSLNVAFSLLGGVGQQIFAEYLRSAGREVCQPSTLADQAAIEALEKAVVANFVGYSHRRLALPEELSRPVELLFPCRQDRTKPASQPDFLALDLIKDLRAVYAGMHLFPLIAHTNNACLNRPVRF